MSSSGKPQASPTQDAERERVQAAFAHANASLALEGLVVDATQASRQQQVVDGKLSIADAIAQAVASHRGGTR
jgi:hypothetical protein